MRTFSIFFFNASLFHLQLHLYGIISTPCEGFPALFVITASAERKKCFQFIIYGRETFFVMRRGCGKKSKGWQSQFLDISIKSILVRFIAFRVKRLTNNVYYWQNSSCFASFFKGEGCVIAANSCGDQWLTRRCNFFAPITCPEGVGIYDQTWKAVLPQNSDSHDSHDCHDWRIWA